MKCKIKFRNTFSPPRLGFSVSKPRQILGHHNLSYVFKFLGQYIKAILDLCISLDQLITTGMLLLLYCILS